MSPGEQTQDDDDNEAVQDVTPHSEEDMQKSWSQLKE